MECAICKELIEPSLRVTLGAKGSASINNASEERKDSLQCAPGQVVHKECRRMYCAPYEITKARRQTLHQDLSSTGQHVLRSAEKQFDFRSDCFYCGKPVASGKKRKASLVVPVRTVETRDTILAVCRERGDDWADTVQARILHVHDLHAADAVYHRSCSTNFRTKKQMPAAHASECQEQPMKKLKLGRPPEKERSDAFLEVARFLEENDDEQITIQDLVHHMEEILAHTEHRAYSYQHMQQKLKEHFGSKIIQTEINGKANVVTFRSKAQEVLHDFYRPADCDQERD